jgi:hypothetical protein
MDGGTLDAGPEPPPGVEEAAAATADPFSGTLGPRRTPAIFGHAMPTMNPIAAITPTFVHDGRSSAGPGTCTVNGPSAFGENIERTVTTEPPPRSKTLRRAPARP